MDRFLGCLISGNGYDLCSSLISLLLGSLRLTSLTPPIAPQGDSPTRSEITASCATSDAWRGILGLWCCLGTMLGTMLKVVTSPATSLDPSRTTGFGDGQTAASCAAIYTGNRFRNHFLLPCFCVERQL